jgi:hypothetical protein
MAEGKYVKIGGAIKEVTAEYAKIGGVIKEVTSNVVKIGGVVKPIDVGGRIVFVCEQNADRLYGYTDSGDELWSQYGATITNPRAVACDSEGNSYWACENNVIKLDPEGNIVWTNSTHNVEVLSICVDADNLVYTGDAGGTLKAMLAQYGTTLRSMDVGTNQSIYALAVHQLGAIKWLYVGCQRIVYVSLYKIRVDAWTKFTIPMAWATYGSVWGVAVDTNGEDIYVGTNNGYLMKVRAADGLAYWGTGAKATPGDVRSVQFGHDGYGYCCFGADNAVVKFDTESGATVWKQELGGVASAKSCAVDLSGHVYSTHMTVGASVENLVRKWSAAGAAMTTWRPYITAEMVGVAVVPGSVSAGF